MVALNITDADYDDMHHALGRPDGPHVKPYRNFYCCAADGPESDRFDALGCWRRAGTINEGRDAVFKVTPEGEALLMCWLKARQRAAGIRAWVVHGGGISARTVMAKTRSAARFEVFRQIEDAYHFEDGLRGFLRLGVQVRAA